MPTWAGIILSRFVISCTRRVAIATDRPLARCRRGRARQIARRNANHPSDACALHGERVSMSERARNWPMGLCVMCGLPGVGKSTLAAALRQKERPYTTVLLSYDDILAADAFEEEAVCEYREVSCQTLDPGGREQSLWKRHRQHLLQCLEHLLVSLSSCSPLQAPSGVPDSLWKRFCQCLAHQGLISAPSSNAQFQRCVLNPAHFPFYFILDDNFYYQSMRYEVYQLARKYSLGFCQLYLQCSVESCLQRNKGRQHPVTDKTILLMERKIEKPNPEKNTWEENSLSLDSSGGGIADDTQIHDLLNRALENPVRPLDDDCEERERDREICAANLIHQADQSLRRLIAETMQTVKGTVASKDIKRIAQELQCVKSKALEQLREHITVQTVLPAKADRDFNVQAYFTEEKERILQPYLCQSQDPRLDCQNSPAIS
ncbi:PREDICTED: L-seryl-tRNA(Sec) kinase [Nanorana parkeri]|uniref:L-seryl-tRNA(Sec) kinase n=1 Tax=Nanorana parkeri TaxID=125878 RepID=UPI0008541E31|nr:PREDICTED: L-seryl-tRNA(Sec) kinase [Nanorana parkeri]